MVVKAITQTLNSEINRKESFKTLYSIIAMELGNVLNNKEFNDYCVFIKAFKTDSGCQIEFHDGGYKYDEIIDDLVHVVYLTLTTKLKIDQDYTFYYSVNEQVLCFLDER